MIEETQMLNLLCRQCLAHGIFPCHKVGQQILIAANLHLAKSPVAIGVANAISGLWSREHPVTKVYLCSFFIQD